MTESGSGGPSTELQKQIVQVVRDNPELSNIKIADKVGCHDTYVGRVRSRFDCPDTQHEFPNRKVLTDGGEDEEDHQDKMARQYEARNARIKETIDVLASEKKPDDYGRVPEIAREHDLEEHRIRYVLDKWEDLVKWRRAANANPLEAEAVKQAYEDDDMAEMVGDEMELASSDGGQATVTIELTLSETYRVMKLLPGDLGMKVFHQVLEDVQELPGKGIDALFPDR